ncbi:MAG: hypothetical protein LBE38_06755 [Deltaproteobacteria bacterium]|jgi:hypothetical protein|nr:hypothetical protein [Deltaproteobacteria bacterium]
MGKSDNENLAEYDTSGAENSLSQEDWDAFKLLTEVILSPDEKIAAETPTYTDEEEERIFALHFHPEWVPMELLKRRIKRAFPKAKSIFAIPTQHNVIMSLGQFSGVEADVFNYSYNMKIQLLIHLKSDKLKDAHTLQSMMEKTFRYRGLQLLDILEQVAFPDEDMKKEIKKMGFHEESIKQARFFASKIKLLVEESGITQTPGAEMLKNRLLTDFIEIRGATLDPIRKDRLLSLVNHIKKMVKSRLNPKRFHTDQEVIEEARALNAGIVIPHPPQFWPVLLDDLDVDGWEVWNPSTPKHTIFLIQCLKRRGKIKRPLLAFMGDDTHMSSKIRPDMVSDKDGAKREIGFQPPWKHQEVQAALKDAGQGRDRTMDEYLARIS